MGKLLLAAVSLFLLQDRMHAQEPVADPIAAKITAAKDAYYAERDKAEQALIVLLEKKEAAAKQAGDLKALEAMRAELDAFRKEGKLPKSVPLTAYEGALKTARNKLENHYTVAIKTLTQADKIAEAKELQTQLANFQKTGTFAAAAPLPATEPANAPPEPANALPAPANDPFQVNSVWKHSSDDNVLTVLERDGEKFRAQYTNNKSFARNVAGTCSNGRVVWLAKDTEALKGERGSDAQFELERDGQVFKLMRVRIKDNMRDGYFLQLQ